MLLYFDVVIITIYFILILIGYTDNDNDDDYDPDDNDTDKMISGGKRTDNVHCLESSAQLTLAVLAVQYVLISKYAFTNTE